MTKGVERRIEAARRGRLIAADGWEWQGSRTVWESALFLAEKYGWKNDPAKVRLIEPAE